MVHLHFQGQDELPVPPDASPVPPDESLGG